MKLLKELGMSRGEAIMRHLDELKWKPNQFDIQDVNAVYLRKLQKSSIIHLPVARWDDVTKEFLGETHSLLHSVTSAILDGHV